MVNDELHVVHARAAGLDVHKMEITATVRLSGAGGPPAAETRRFEALPSGLRELAGWLRGLGVSAAAMEGTGVYWEAPHDALAEAGIEVQLLHAQQVKQLRGRKTDIADSRWLARVCQFGLGQPSFVPAREFRELRVLCRHRRTLVGERSRVRNRAGKVVDRSGARVGGVISDIFGMNGRRILDGLVDRLGRDAILETLSSHVRDKVDRLGDALTAAMSDADRVVLGDLLRQHDAVERRIGRWTGRSRRASRRTRTGCACCRRSRASTPSRRPRSSPRPDRTRRACSAAPTAWPPGPASAPATTRAPASAAAPAPAPAPATCAACWSPARTARARTRTSQFHAYHGAIAGRRGHKRAIVATARKLARVIYAVLRDGKPYRDPAVDYEALLVKRKAPRWIAKLREFGILERHDDGTVTVNWASA